MPSPSEVMAERDWHLYLKDMRVFAERAIRYSDGLTRDLISNKPPQT